MLGQSGITVTKGVNVDQILASTQLQYSASIMVSNAGVSANDKGRKIVKAGTPLAGDLTARGTAFTVVNDSTAKVLALHDVDVTEGTANVAGLVFGFVDLTKVSTEAKALLTDEVKTALTKITFVA